MVPYKTVFLLTKHCCVQKTKESPLRPEGDFVKAVKAENVKNRQDSAHKPRSIAAKRTLGFYYPSMAQRAAFLPRLSRVAQKATGASFWATNTHRAAHSEWAGPTRIAESSDNRTLQIA